MLKQINNFYLFISIILFSFLIPKSDGVYPLIVSLNILSVFTYSTLLYISSNINNKYYQKKYLLLTVLLYGAIFIFFNNFVSYYYANDFWVFNKADALFYNEETLKILSLPLDKAISTYLHYNVFDDLGMILILYPLYHIVESNLILNIFYLLISLITALGIFNISKQLMSKKYAYISSVAYSLSSFVLYFHSIGLKESFLVMLVVQSFNFYYHFLKTEKPIMLLLSLVFIVSIILFRPAISVIIIVSIGLSSLLSKKGGIGIKIISLFIIVFLISMSSMIIPIIERYTSGGFEMLIYARESEGMIKGSIGFTYAVNILAQLVGPLPTLVSSEKIILTFFGAGLIYRVLLAFPFWIGIRYVFKTKSYMLYPLAIFVVLEMSSLALILEGLELRKALPHLFGVYIIAFWFLDKYDSKSISIKKRKRFKYFFRFSMFILFLIIFYWNFK